MSEKAASVQRKEEACIGADAGLEGSRARASDCGDTGLLEAKGDQPTAQAPNDGSAPLGPCSHGGVND